MKELTNTPILRFPEFKSTWHRSTIEKSGLKIIDGDRGNNYPNGSDFSLSGYCLFLNAKNVTKSGFNFSETSFITKTKDEQLRKGKLKRYDIVLTTRGTVGNIAFFSDKIPFGHIRINSGMVIIRNENTEISQAYLYILLSSPEKRKKLVEVSFGSAQPQLTVSQIYKLKIEYPSIEEQYKLAKFLSSFETKIQQLSLKKQLLEQYKLEIIQRIFTQEVRFKDSHGNAFPNWKEYKMGDFDFHPTNSLSRTQLNYDTGKIKNVHYGDIHTRLKSNFILNREEIPFINIDVDASKISNDSYLKVGDLIIADASEDYKDIGKSIEVIDLNNCKIVAGLHTILLRDSKQLTAVGFKGYMMQTQYIRMQLMRYSTGSSVLGITKSNVAKIKIKLPTIDEQKKIVAFLTDLDDKIDCVIKQFIQAQKFKRGLLQQMFI